MSRGTFLRWLFVLSVGLVLLFWAADAILDRTVVRTGLLADVVDIQTPTTLFAKLDYLRRFPGYKVVLLGDSVIYGRALEEHGDADWRQHTLEALLAERFRKAMPSHEVLVMNLALTGALPADLERLAELVEPCRPDLLIFDVGLRSFSADFAAKNAQLSRSWLEQVAVDPEGRFREAALSGSLAGRLVAGLENTLTNHWEFYRLRDFVRARWLEGQPRTFLQKVRDRTNHLLLRQNNRGAALDDDLILAMKVRRRFSTVNLRPDNPQRQALERLLCRLRERKQQALVFYAKENPERIFDLLTPERYHTLSAELQDLLGASAGPDLVFLPPLEELNAEHFLDFIHCNREGLQILSEHIWQELAKSFVRRSEN